MRFAYQLDAHPSDDWRILFWLVCLCRALTSDKNDCFDFHLNEEKLMESDNLFYSLIILSCCALATCECKFVNNRSQFYLNCFCGNFAICFGWKKIVAGSVGWGNAIVKVNAWVLIERLLQDWSWCFWLNDISFKYQCESCLRFPRSLT